MFFSSKLGMIWDRKVGKYVQHYKMPSNVRGRFRRVWECLQQSQVES